MAPSLANPLSTVLRVLHWLIFIEALYCYVVFGIAYSLGEGVPAALDVLIRVALLEEGWQAASVPLPYLCLPISSVCLSPPKHSDLFPGRAKNSSALVANHCGEVNSKVAGK